MSSNIDIHDYVFYKIISKDKNVISFYVGSTADGFGARQQKHKASCRCPKAIGYNLKLYRFIRENGDWDNFNMIELSNTPNITKWEARMIEQAYMDDLLPDLNDKNAFCGRDVRKEQKRITNKTYREGEHREKLLAKKREYYEKNLEAIKEYRATQEFKDKKNARRRETYALKKLTHL